jgi:peroxiredoxin
MKGIHNKDDFRAREYAPDFRLATTQGSSLSLKDLFEHKCAVVLVFLRHLG